MSHSAQTRLNPTNNDRRLFINLTNQITVDDRRIVRTFSHNAARRKCICLTSLFRHRVVIHHRIHIPTGYKESKARFTVFCNAAFIFPVRLTDQPNFISIRLQKACDDRMPKRRMIHVGISGNIDKIQLFPASLLHIFSANR